MAMTTGRPLRVALDLPLRTGDAAFTFAAGAAAGAPRGTGVVVPFGRRLVPGVVLGDAEARGDLRPILAVTGPSPLVPAPVVDLVEWTAREYVSSVGEALAVATPWDALWHGVRIRVSAEIGESLSSGARAALRACGGRSMSLARAARLLTVQTPDVLDELAEARVFAVSTAPPRTRPSAAPAVSPAGVPVVDRAAPPHAPLSAATKARVEAAIREALAHGPRSLLVAGWSRTPAYLAAIALAREAGRSCAVAFASVDSAAAFVTDAARAGFQPVQLHGDLPRDLRLSGWRSLIGTRGMLAVGTRAAVFAPFADPGLIIVDDEDGAGHKEERAPRYLTAVVAAHRAGDDGTLLIGAATPTVASYAAVQDGRVRLLALPSPRPRIGVIDLRRRSDPDAPLSRPALVAVRRVARAGGRAVVLADRKGYAGGLHCGECGAVVRCPQCGVAMPYDRGRRRLACRVCGRAVPAPGVCARCGAADLRLLGAGTERLASTLRRQVPRVWRFDADVTDGQGAAEVLAVFQARGGVLVATIKVLPHLARLRPDVVIVASADRWLHRPEFRAAERTLALLRDVGLAGRAQVLVETADPNHPVIAALAAPNLRAFYTAELKLREDLGYPPYRSLAAIMVTARGADAADEIAARLRATPSVDVLGPIATRRPPSGPGSWTLVARAADRSSLRESLWSAVGAVQAGRARVVFDVDPVDL